MPSPTAIIQITITILHEQDKDPFSPQNIDKFPAAKREEFIKMHQDWKTIKRISHAKSINIGDSREYMKQTRSRQLGEVRIVATDYYHIIERKPKGWQARISSRTYFHENNDTQKKGDFLKTTYV
jgi:hypothetical protein